MFPRFILSSVGFLYIWFGSPRSKIGSPVFYWEQGILPLIGFVALSMIILLTVIISFAFILEDRGEKNLEVDLPCFPCLCVVGLILMQILPVPLNGIQIFPYSGASYVGPLATKIWLACWFSMGITLVTYWAGNIKFVSLSVLVLLSAGFSHNCFAVKQQPVASTQSSIALSSTSLKSASMLEDDDAKALLEANKRQREKMSAVLQQLQSEYRKIAPASFPMKPSDRSASRDRMNQQLNAEWQELELQISRVKSDVERLDETILGMESVMRRKERQRLVRDQGLLNDADYEALLKKFLLLSGEPGVSAAK